MFFLFVYLFSVFFVFYWNSHIIANNVNNFYCFLGMFIITLAFTLVVNVLFHLQNLAGYEKWRKFHIHSEILYKIISSACVGLSMYEGYAFSLSALFITDAISTLLIVVLFPACIMTYFYYLHWILGNKRGKCNSVWTYIKG